MTMTNWYVMARDALLLVGIVALVCGAVQEESRELSSASPARCGTNRGVYHVCITGAGMKGEFRRAVSWCSGGKASGYRPLSVIRCCRALTVACIDITPPGDAVS